VPIGDEEPATVGLQRVLESGRDVEVSVRRIGQVELANVSNDGETLWAVHSVDADNIAAADVRTDEGDQYVRGLADERDVDRPTDADDRRRQTGGERRFLPGQRIDARDPAGCAFGNVQRTIEAMALPFAPCTKPVTSRVTVGPSHGGAAVAADGVIIATRAAANNSTIPIPTDFVMRIAGFRASARMFCLFMI
jgi:hypothetical protein